MINKNNELSKEIVAERNRTLDLLKWTLERKPNAFPQRARQVMIDDETWRIALEKSRELGLRSISEYIRTAIHVLAGRSVEHGKDGIPNKAIPKRFLKALWIMDLMAAIISNGARQTIELRYRDQLSAQYQTYYSARDAVKLVAQMMRVVGEEAIADEEPIKKHEAHDVLIISFPIPMKAKDIIRCKQMMMELISKRNYEDLVVELEKDRKKVEQDDSGEIKEKVGIDGIGGAEGGEGVRGDVDDNTE